MHYLIKTHVNRDVIAYKNSKNGMKILWVNLNKI